MSPNHSLDMQSVVEAAVLEGTEVREGFGVAKFVDVVVVEGSSQPPNQPGDAQLAVEEEVEEAVEVIVVGSLQPNQPGVSQVVVLVSVEVEVVVEVGLDTEVVVGTGKMLLEVVMMVCVVLSLHPNQPGYFTLGNGIEQMRRALLPCHTLWM